MTKPRWNLEDKDFWMDSFITLLPSVLAETPNCDNNDKLISNSEYETRLLERVETCAKACDRVLEEMQFRFWNNAREPKVRYGGRSRDRGRNRANVGGKGE